MTSAMIWILVAVVVYLLGMLAIGFKYANNSTSEDFYLCLLYTSTRDKTEKEYF